MVGGGLVVGFFSAMTVSLELPDAGMTGRMKVPIVGLGPADLERSSSMPDEAPVVCDTGPLIARWLVEPLDLLPGSSRGSARPHPLSVPRRP